MIATTMILPLTTKDENPKMIRSMPSPNSGISTDDGYDDKEWNTLKRMCCQSEDGLF